MRKQFTQLATCLGSITLLCLISLTACTSRTHRQLQQIATLVDSVPERARQQLDSMNNSSLSRGDAALYALLKTQADYKCYVPLTSDSLIRIAVDYYGDKKSYRAAMASYYLGCTYTELNNDEEAVRAYLKAESLFPDTTVKCYGLCAQNKGIHYRNKQMFKEALKEFNIYRNYSLSKQNQGGVAIADYHLALTYLYDQQFDEAQTRFKAIAEDDSITSAFCRNDALFQLAKIELSHCNNCAQAIDYINRSIAGAADKQKIAAYYCTKGDIFQQCGQLDSAQHYYQIALHNGKSLYTQCSTYQQLAYIYMQLQNYDSVYAYTQRHDLLLDSIYKLQNQQEVNNVRTEHLLAQNTKQLQEQHTRFVHCTILIAISFIVIAIFVFMMIDRQRKKRYIQWQQQMATNRLELLNEKSKSNEAPNALRLQELRNQKLEYCIQAFRKTPWAKKLNELEINRSAKNFTKKERDDLYVFLTKQFTDVMVDLKDECSGLNSDDLQLCIYSLLHFSTKTLLKCTSYTKDSLQNRKSRLKKKMPEELFNRIFSKKTD